MTEKDKKKMKLTPSETVRSQPSVTPPKPSFKHRPPLSGRTWALLALFLVGVLAGSGYWYWHDNRGVKTKAPGSVYSYSHSYKDLVLYQLAGSQPGSGVKIEVPSEFGIKPGQIDKEAQADYSQTDLGSGPLPQGFIPEQVAHLGLSSLYSPSSFSADFKQAYGQAITTPQGGQGSILGGVQTYVTERLPAGYEVTLGDVRPLSSVNIKSDAWIIQYVAKARAGQNSSNLPDLTGEVVVALGKQTTYYIMLDAVNSNWQASQNTWQQVVDSIKVDQ